MQLKQAKIAFPNHSEHDKFEASFAEWVRKLQSQVQSQFISPENVQHYHHGRSWQSHYSDHPDEPSSMKHLSHRMEIQFDDIVDSNLTVVRRSISDAVEGMQREIMRTLYQTLDESCTRSGNIEKPEGRSIADTFYSALERLKFGVDRDGNATLPQCHIGAKALSALKADVEKRGPEFQIKIDELTKRKKAEALEEEAARLARFTPEPDA